MSDFRHTCTIKCGHEVNGLSETAYKIADKYQIDCKIDREVIKTGWDMNIILLILVICLK